jgi:hypothetical protein
MIIRAEIVVGGQIKHPVRKSHEPGKQTRILEDRHHLIHTVPFVDKGRNGTG